MKARATLFGAARELLRLFHQAVVHSYLQKEGGVFPTRIRSTRVNLLLWSCTMLQAFTLFSCLPITIKKTNVEELEEEDKKALMSKAWTRPRNFANYSIQVQHICINELGPGICIRKILYFFNSVTR